MTRERVDIKSYARNPEDFEDQKFWIEEDQYQGTVLLDWSSNPTGMKVEIPEFVFREMVNQYFENRYAEPLLYKGLTGLTGELYVAGQWYVPYKPSEAERIERFREIGYGRKNDKA